MQAMRIATTIAAVTRVMIAMVKARSRRSVLSGGI